MNDPTSLTWMLAATGSLLIVSGLIGGGFDLRGIKVPAIGKVPRVLCSLAGVGLIGLTFVQLGVQPGGDDGPVDEQESGAPLLYRAVRTMVTDDESLRAVVDYSLELQQAADTGERVAEFRLASASITPREAERDALIDALVGSPGYVPLDALETLDLTLSWSAFMEFLRERRMETAGAGGEHADLAFLGPAMWAKIVETQVRFDLVAMLSTPSPDDSGRVRLELQAADTFLSRIRVDGRGTVHGDERVVPVLRKGPRDDEERKVGEAHYDMATGRLVKLDLSYDVNPGEPYRLLITRE